MAVSASMSPSVSPSPSPSASPSVSPSASPSKSPSASPSVSPSASPSLSPSASVSPSVSPSGSPSVSPSKSPSASPSGSPSRSGSVSPSASPSVSPSASPSAGPYVEISYESGGTIRGIRVYKWINLRGEGTTGQAIDCGNFADKSVQVTGTFGGATVTIQGSNIVTSPTYATLNDPTGSAITFTSAGIKGILENTYWVRPIISSVTDSTDLNVYLLVETTR